MLTLETGLTRHKLKLCVTTCALVFPSLLLTLAGCGGSSSSPATHVPPAISVSLQPTPPGTMAVTATATIGAVVVNGSGSSGVSWSCSPAGACGSFGSATTSSGVNTTYTAPATVPSPNPVTITATAVGDSSKSASAAVTISPTPSADFFVAPNGNDSGPGTISAPFATIAHAQAAVRGILTGRSNSVVVMLRAGTYFLNQPLSFTAADSGTPAVEIAWQNYPGEAPVVSGGMQIASWTQGGSNQWTATLPAGTQYFEQLFYNGQRRLRPRLGGTLGTYYRVAAPVYLPGSSSGPAPDPNCSVYVSGLGWECFDRFHYAAGDPINANWTNLSPPPGNPCNAASVSPYPIGDIALYSFEQMGVSKMLINCVDAANQIIYLTGPIHMDAVSSGFVPGHRYLIENVKDASTQPGQWFLDRSKTPWTLTCLANPGENPNTDTVIVPQMPAATPQVLLATNLHT